ncbi:MAG: tRNA pseudouridine(38-40) synthase TruA [Lentisphaerae bacterium]|nr:tRNA pseudouridine(38-40) synthase TruA [Lentisphaerota bacterium]
MTTASPQRYKMRIAYDGTSYAGWQLQPNALTVQEVVEKALATVCGERPRLHGSGRTDQGVHARAQVSHFDLGRAVPTRRTMVSLNAVLPPDIRVLGLTRAAADFHARRSARGKEYRYFIWNDEVLPPFIRCYRAHIRKPLDVSLMREAARQLVGRHDFAAFSANPNREVETTVRQVTELRVTRRGSEITIAARGEGFLYKMVRSLAGFLIRVGEGAVPPAHARDILASRERTARVPTAPASGLFLWKVWY